TAVMHQPKVTRGPILDATGGQSHVAVGEVTTSGGAKPRTHAHPSETAGVDFHPRLNVNVGVGRSSRVKVFRGRRRQMPAQLAELVHRPAALLARVCLPGVKRSAIKDGHKVFRQRFARPGHTDKPPAAVVHKLAFVLTIELHAHYSPVHSAAHLGNARWGEV